MNCEGDHEIYCMNFNQDGTSLSAGCKSGFYLYGLSNATEKLDVNFIHILHIYIHIFLGSFWLKCTGCDVGWTSF